MRNSMVVESHANIGYSKVRVAFDSDQKLKTSSMLLASLSSSTMSSSNNNNSNHLASNHAAYGPPSVTMRAPHEHNNAFFNRYVSSTPEVDPPLPSNNRFSTTMHQAASNSTTMSSPASSVNQEHAHMAASQQPAVVGDISEPFWIQSTKEGSMWTDPDELFLTESKRFFTFTDKRIFWEMAHALIELPEISNACKGTIRNAADLVTLLKKPEWKIIWSNEAADILPREMAAELVKAAYVYVSADRN
jgi:hypothetical protein